VHYRRISAGIWGTASTFVATVVGAGFASGQEILQFFVAFGDRGYLGAVLSVALLTVSALSAVLMADRFGTAASYRQVLEQVIPPRLVLLFDCMFSTALLTGTAAMLAGSGALAAHLLRSGGYVGTLFTAATVALILHRGLPGVIAVSAVLTPLLIAGISVITVAALTGPPPGGAQMGVTGSLIPTWWLGSFSYASLNSIPLIALFGSSGSRTGATAGVIKGICLGGIMLLILVFTITGLLRLTSAAALQEEIPMLGVAGFYTGLSGVYIYGVIIWLAMFTTALTNAQGLLVRVGQLLPALAADDCLCIVISVALLMASAGFRVIVSHFYPAVGYMGLIVLLLMITGIVLRTH